MKALWSAGRWTFMILSMLVLVSCLSGESTQAPNVSPTQTPEPAPVQGLQLEFADPEWDGVNIPDGQQCRRAGTENPSSPRIRVGGIPAEADAIVLEFSDRDYSPMDDGGHGKFGLVIPLGTEETVIASIPGNTFDLPPDFFLVEEHGAAGFDTAGAYMPPCSGGTGNDYYVTVKAVELISLEETTFKVLEQAVLELGKY